MFRRQDYSSQQALWENLEGFWIKIVKPDKSENLRKTQFTSDLFLKHGTRSVIFQQSRGDMTQNHTTNFTTDKRNSSINQIFYDCNI